MPYAARYRFILRSPLKVDENTATAVQVHLGDFPAVTLEVGKESEAGGRWVIAKVDGFACEEEARRVGESLGDALLVVGAITKLGIDVGFSQSTLQFGRRVHDLVSESDGKELRAETHGLMVYEKDSIVIIGIEGRASVSISLEWFTDHLSRQLGSKVSLTDRQRTCAALINDSFFVARTEAQLLLRISAVEALCEQKSRNPECLAAIERLQQYLVQQELNLDVQETLQRTLTTAKLQTARSAYLEKFRTFCSERDAKAFDKLYEKRSKLLHEGLGRGELKEAANEALELAVRILGAELSNSIAKKVEGV